jgi:hypothetical protein
MHDLNCTDFKCSAHLQRTLTSKIALSFEYILYISTLTLQLLHFILFAHTTLALPLTMGYQSFWAFWGPFQLSHKYYMSTTAKASVTQGAIPLLLALSSNLPHSICMRRANPAHCKPTVLVCSSHSWVHKDVPQQAWMAISIAHSSLECNAVHTTSRLVQKCMPTYLPTRLGSAARHPPSRGGCQMSIDLELQAVGNH